ncbi:hypothetical protein [Helicobacter sp. T3_23-1056]
MINIDLNNDKIEIENQGFLKDEMLYVVATCMEHYEAKAHNDLIVAEFLFKKELESYRQSLEMRRRNNQKPYDTKYYKKSKKLDFEALGLIKPKK